MLVLLLGLTGTLSSQEADVQDAAESSSGEPQIEELTLQGPHPLPLSLPLYRVATSDGALDEHVGEVRFTQWRNPDRMRASVSSGRVRVTAAPSYAAANLYNRGLDIRMVDVAVWGMLNVVGPAGETLRWSDLEGKTVYSPFRGDMPDLVFKLLARSNGLEPGVDFEMEYVSAPPQLIKLFAVGRADYGVLPEHPASAAILRARKQGRELARVMDLQEAWGETTGAEARIPQGSIIVTGELAREHPEVVRALHHDLAEASEWVMEHPKQAAELAQGHFELPKPLIRRSVPHFNLDVVSAAEARKELEFFYEELASMSPEIIGGKLPDDPFYYRADE
jgi:NitT/TauT family transport system substrate-binding protein